MFIGCPSQFLREEFALDLVGPIYVSRAFSKRVRFDTTLWVFSILKLVFMEVIKCIGLGFLERFIREMAWRLDKTLQPKMTKTLFFRWSISDRCEKGNPRQRYR